ncbi:MAG: ATP-binding protein [Pseudolysinimonas sp.]
MTWRFMLALMGVTAVVLAVLLIPISGYLTQSEHDRITTALERDAFVLAGRSAASLEAPSAAASVAITDLARRYRDSSEGARVVIVDADGTAIVTSDDDPAALGSSFRSRPEIRIALSGQIANGMRYSQTLSLELLYVAVPVLHGDKVVGAVRLTYPAQVVTDAANAKLGGLGIVALTTVLLAGAVGWIFSRSVTRRLRRLTELTEQVAEGDLSVRAEERTGAPELRSLARSFNSMTERLTAALDQQRRFAADASHQLRTPLTALRLRLERARELVGPESAESAERIAAAESEADRLETLVEGLLQLSRGEGTIVAIGQVDVAAIARERVEQWRPLGEERGLAIEYRGPDAAVALAASSVVEQIIDNYLDNAMSVSTPGSTVEVRVDHDTHRSTVHVLDRGPGMPPEALERAFDRFWRARSDGSGSGLGLSIVSQLAQASGAEVQLANRIGGGLDASVRFGTKWTPPRSSTRRREQSGSGRGRRRSSAGGRA